MDFTKYIIYVKGIYNLLQKIESETQGYNIYLGGGYIRDYYYSYMEKDGWYINEKKEPKDIDIFFIPKKDCDPNDQCIPILPKTYITYNVACDEIKDMRDNVERVIGIKCYDINPIDVQLIFYKEHITQVELAEDMDCNINQAMYSIRDHKLYLTDAFISGHENKVIEMLHDFQYERMHSRIKRMMSKFPEYSVVHQIPSDVWVALEKESKKEKVTTRVSGASSGGSFIKD